METLKSLPNCLMSYNNPTKTRQKQLDKNNAATQTINRRPTKTIYKEDQLFEFRAWVALFFVRMADLWHCLILDVT